MTASWLLFLLLSIATGNPLVALLLALAVLWTADRVTVGVLPEPARAFLRWRRVAKLRAALAVNPNDRRARLELADLLLARRPAEAAELVTRNVEAGDEDVHTSFLLGAALARSGAHDRAERAFAFARELEPAFRLGEIDLELGRMRLARGDAAGAREALERLVEARPGTVEGRWLLARALAALGDVAGAERVRADAWREFVALPRFRRRPERAFAWRLKPWRGAAAMVAVVLLVTLGAVLVAAVAVIALPAEGGSCDVRRASEELSLGGRRVTITWFERRGGITMLAAFASPRTGEARIASDADMQELRRVTQAPRDPRRAYAHLWDGVRVTIVPISMRVADVERIRAAHLGSYDELVAYVRRFEDGAAAPPAVPAAAR